jgi:hypothetical protein
VSAGEPLGRTAILPEAEDLQKAPVRCNSPTEKLRILAETCERVKIFWSDAEPFLKAVYAFGEVLDGADPLDAVQVAVAINLPLRKSRGSPAPVAPTGWRPSFGSARAASRNLQVSGW